MQNILIFCITIFCFCLHSNGMLNFNSFNGLSSPTRGKNEIKNIQFEPSNRLKSTANIHCGSSTKQFLSMPHLVEKCSSNVSQKTIQIVASKFPSNQSPKKCFFNYERQLKIMLSHQRKIEEMQQKLCSHRKHAAHINEPLSYNVFALKDALDNEIKYEKFNSGVHTETQRVLSIVNSLWESVKYLEQSAKIPCVYVNGRLMQLQEEQMRFIGLILWHFVFRQNPIFDSSKENWVFFANVWPNIDPSDVLTIRQMLKEMEKQLEERADRGKHIGNFLDEKQFCDEFNHDMQLLDHHQPGMMDSEKQLELTQKWQLLQSQYICLVDNNGGDDDQQQRCRISTPLPLYCMVDRAFIACGKEAPALILLAKALLEGKMDGKQLENYLKNDQNLFNNISIGDDDNSYGIMASQLGKISKQY